MRIYAVEPPFSAYSVAKDILCDVLHIAKSPTLGGSLGVLFVLGEFSSEM